MFGRVNRWLAALTLSLVAVDARGSSFLEETMRRALSGDLEAQRTLAYLYSAGKGVIRNDREAGRWRAPSFNREVKRYSANPRRPNTQYRSPALPPAPSRGIEPRRPYRKEIDEKVGRRGGRSNPVARTGKLLVSPISFTLKQSRRLVTRVARTVAFAKVGVL